MMGRPIPSCWLGLAIGVAVLPTQPVACRKLVRELRVSKHCWEHIGQCRKRLSYSQELKACFCFVGAATRRLLAGCSGRAG